MTASDAHAGRLSRSERMHSIARGDGRWTPVAPRPAATVVLVRDGADGGDGAGGIETYLQRRPLTFAFAPGMWVFPGGRVDDDDRDDLDTAVREVREEAGIDLARDALTLFDHWVTPEVESRRFDVRFFLARTPDGAHPVPAADEVDADAWLLPRIALDRFAVGEMPMLRPTLAVLEWLGGFATVADAQDAALMRDIRWRMPRPVLVDDVMHWMEVDVTTGETLRGPVRMPHAWEDTAAAPDASIAHAAPQRATDDAPASDTDGSSA